MSNRATKNTLLNDVNQILGIKDSYEAPGRMLEILKNPAEREGVFFKFLELFDYNLDEEWFYKYFQEEHADRKNNKQDFTPNSLSSLLSEMINSRKSDDGYIVIAEVSAGTGGMVISHWANERRKYLPWTFKPDDYLYLCTELSKKTIPFLIFNLMIRGINAIVIHGNSLTYEAENAYWIYNEKNDFMSFSDLYVAEHSEKVEKLLNIKFKTDRSEK